MRPKLAPPRRRRPGAGNGGSTGRPFRRFLLTAQARPTSHSDIGLVPKQSGPTEQEHQMPVRRTIIVASTLGALAAGSAFGAAVLTPAVSGAASSPSTTAPATATSPSGVPAGPPHNFEEALGGHVASGI